MTPEQQIAEAREICALIRAGKPVPCGKGPADDYLLALDAALSTALSDSKRKDEEALSADEKMLAANALRIAAGDFGPCKIDDMNIWRDQYRALMTKLHPASWKEYDHPYCKHGCGPAFLDGKRAQSCYRCELERKDEEIERLERSAKGWENDCRVALQNSDDYKAKWQAAEDAKKVCHEEHLYERGRAEAAESRAKFYCERLDWAQKEINALQPSVTDLKDKASAEEARIKEAMDAGYAQGVEVTEARAGKRIERLEEEVLGADAARELDLAQFRKQLLEVMGKVEPIIKAKEAAEARVRQLEAACILGDAAIAVARSGMQKENEWIAAGYAKGVKEIEAALATERQKVADQLSLIQEQGAKINALRSRAEGAEAALAEARREIDGRKAPYRAVKEVQAMLEAERDRLAGENETIKKWAQAQHDADGEAIASVSQHENVLRTRLMESNGCLKIVYSREEGKVKEALGEVIDKNNAALASPAPKEDSK